MGSEVQPPPGQPGSNPAAEPSGRQGYGRGADAGLYLIAAIAILAFISMLGVLSWVASRENAASVAALPAATTQSPEKGEGVVMLPIISGKSTGKAETQLTTPMPSDRVSPIVEGTIEQVATQTTDSTFFQSPVFTSPSQLSRTPSDSQNASTTTPSHAPGATPTPTTSGDATTLLIRNDQGCVDSRNNDLYIFGEIVNNSSVSVVILSWDVKIYDNGQIIQTDDIFLDIPNKYAIFANSSIPFALLTTLDRPTFTDYDISLDFAPDPHTPRNDLSIIEYSSTQSSGFTEIVGKWNYTDVANPPDIVWIIATIRDTQGRLTNLQYQQYLNASIPDPRLPPGQHTLRQLYLEDNPCGGGTISVSILGE